MAKEYLVSAAAMGFIATEFPLTGISGKQFAFSGFADLATWLVRQFPDSEPDAPEEHSPHRHPGLDPGSITPDADVDPERDPRLLQTFTRRAVLDLIGQRASIWRLEDLATQIGFIRELLRDVERSGGARPHAALIEVAARVLVAAERSALLAQYG